MSIYIRTSQQSTRTPSPSRKERVDLGELKAVIARGDYNVPATEIAEKMLSAKVFHRKKHG